ncbi:FAD-dependent monooxygenase [Allokutzneria albata]|nr:FAD-dependent monooxygenase [Allokutzneria albata]
MLACEPALAGVRSLVLERLTDLSGVQRANGLVGQVIRMLDRRGLYERLTSPGAIPEPTPRFVFGACPFDLSDLAHNPVCTMMVPQRSSNRIPAVCRLSAVPGGLATAGSPRSRPKTITAAIEPT